ncbi:hypothetical protein EDB84DRAFT_1573940 [Lactarius hengduanensis]|nr:hypothetical protein EDB84DRAFT_1573940 [Lactarius hengduanensis]
MPLLLGMTADLMDLDKTPPAAELEDAAEGKSHEAAEWFAAILSRCVTSSRRASGGVPGWDRTVEGGGGIESNADARWDRTVEGGGGGAGQDNQERKGPDSGRDKSRGAARNSERECESATENCVKQWAPSCESGQVL